MNVKAMLCPHHSNHSALFFSFITGVIFGPFSKGLLLYIISQVVFEFIHFHIYWYYEEDYTHSYRFASFYFGLVGWVLSSLCFKRKF